MYRLEDRKIRELDIPERKKLRIDSIEFGKPFYCPY